MKKINFLRLVFFLLIILLLPPCSFAQNMVPNPGFETISAVPTTYGQITNATGWSSANGSADLFHTSSAAGTVGIPSNYFGTQNTHGGNAYSGIAWSNSASYHELIRVQLTSALTIGNSYYAEAYVSAGEGAYRYGVNNFGFLLTTTMMTGGAGDPPLAATPQVNWTTPITDYTNWTLVSGTFTATTAAQHLTIGSFYSVAASTWVLLGTAGSINSQYWFIDDVVVQPNTVLDAEEITVHTTLSGTKDVLVTWENSSADLPKDYTVERSDDGGTLWKAIGRQNTTEGNSSTYSLKDTPGVYGTPLSYRIRMVSEDGSVSRSSASVIVVAAPSLKESLVLAPSPVRQGENTDIRFYLNQSSLADIRVTGLTGNTVWEESTQLSAGAQTISLPASSWPPGVYFVTVNNQHEAASIKFNITAY